MCFCSRDLNLPWYFVVQLSCLVCSLSFSEMDSGGFSLNSADNKGILSLLSAIEQTGDNFETDPESPEPIKDHIEGHETAFNQLEGEDYYMEYYYQ